MSEIKDNTLKKLSEVIYTLLAKKQYGEEYYELFLIYALSAHEMYNTHGYFGKKTIEVTPTAFNVIYLPNDCLEWISLDVLKGVHLFSYARSWNMIKKFQELDKEGQLKAGLNYLNEIEQYQFVAELDTEGYEVGKIFGMRAKYNEEGFYNYDRAKREIYIKPLSNPAGKLYLTYISNCIDSKEEALVHPNFVQAYEAYMDWQYHEHSDNQVMYRRAKDKERMYNNEMMKLNALEMDLSMEDIEEVVWDSYSLVPLY
jgi:hypothetical protein